MSHLFIVHVILIREHKSSPIAGFSQVVSSFEKCPNEHEDYSRKMILDFIKCKQSCKIKHGGQYI